MSRLSMLAVAIVLATGPWSAKATTVIRAPISELAASSDVIIVGVVRFVDDDLSEGPDGPFLTAIDIEVHEVVTGLDPATEVFRLILPGGRASGRIMRIPGMPVFRVGQEVVLLLERHARGYALTGLSQGVFTVRRDGTMATATRDLRGVHLVGTTAEASLPERVPLLDELLRDLRRWSASAADGSEP